MNEDQPENDCPCGRPHSAAQGKRNSEVTDIVTRCWLGGIPPEPCCTVDNGLVSPDWLKAGDVIWWYIVLHGTLEVGGVRIPLSTRWILCPAHAYLAREEERTI